MGDSEIWSAAKSLLTRWVIVRVSLSFSLIAVHTILAHDAGPAGCYHASPSSTIALMLSRLHYDLANARLPANLPFFKSLANDSRKNSA